MLFFGIIKIINKGNILSPKEEKLPFRIGIIPELKMGLRPFKSHLLIKDKAAIKYSIVLIIKKTVPVLAIVVRFLILT